MSAIAHAAVYAKGPSSEVQIATFYVGDLLLGIDIRQVQEINRHLEITRVPQAPPFVHGVSNLRGDVVTVVDLRKILGLPANESSEKRYVVLQSLGESIGLLVDEIADVLAAPAEDFAPPPSNIGGVERRFFSAVYTMDTELLVILNVQEMLESS